MPTLELEARLDNLLSTAQAETADIDMFAPIPLREECPICLLPLSIKDNENTFMICCGKRICQGCTYKYLITEFKNDSDTKTKRERLCAFCRQTAMCTDRIKKLKKLMKRGNTGAFIKMAKDYKSGEGVIQSDTKSLEMYIRAAELGCADAYGWIGSYYHDGTAVEQDTSKALDYFVISAKKGCITSHKLLARMNEGIESVYESIEHSIGHFKVLASAGDKDSMDILMDKYKEKALSKEDLTLTLRAFQTSNDAMKSNDRENARLIEECRKRGEAPPAHLFK